MKKRLVVANWKRYVDSPDEAKKFVSALRKRGRLFGGVEVIIAPQFPLLSVVRAALKGSPISLAAQTVSHFEDSKHTGEVGARALKHAGVSHVIIGHSERRAEGETDEMIALQLERVLEEELTPILCVGEDERSPDGAHFEVIEKQLSLLRGKGGNVLVAYEPVWAIGKNADAAMKPQELEETVIFIRKVLAEGMDRKLALRVPILYGGSVEGSNASNLITETSVAGFLVGRASAELDSFLEILKACRK